MKHIFHLHKTSFSDAMDTDDHSHTEEIRDEVSSAALPITDQNRCSAAGLPQSLTDQILKEPGPVKAAGVAVKAKKTTNT